MNFFNYVRSLAKPLTIWRLKYGQVIMILSEPYKPFENGSEYVKVLRQDTNEEGIEYFDVLFEACKIG